ncbi:MAG: hypothetical protein CM15mP74_12920 [Halieaceae bacterium]|nr:MAG: hypothetical protein CM15mP74_12920 [Halieaceae bacterium]
MAKDIRVILVKLADRLHNMRTLGVLNREKIKRIASETLDIYAPIAMRLGMNEVRMEFEDLGLKALYPMRARRLEAARRAASGNRKQLVDQIRDQIGQTLNREGLSANVVGREKHLFSIYNKMKAKRKSFSEVMDIFAFRLLVDSVDDCYRALGMVHSLYKPVPGEFKDYIAIPKANGYQSLHTVLKGMHGVPIEIQIRTHEMEDMANNGLPPTGFTRPRKRARVCLIPAPENGCRGCWKCNNAPATRWNLLRTSRSTYSLTRFMFLPLGVTFSSCRKGPVRSTLRMPCIAISGITA